MVGVVVQASPSLGRWGQACARTQTEMPAWGRGNIRNRTEPNPPTHQVKAKPRVQACVSRGIVGQTVTGRDDGRPQRITND